MKLTKIAVLAGLFLGTFSISISSAFSDLPSSHWAYDKVNKMQEKGVISGYEDGTFRPQNEVTREEFATILSKALDLTKKSTDINFRDVSNDRWSKKYIDSVSLYLTGYEANGEYYFKPEEAAVREDMAVAVVKARGLENETPDYTILDKFSDKALMSENMKKYIAIAVKNGIMNGNADGTFNPLGNLTRAEITALMWNVSEKVVIGDEIKEVHVHSIATKHIYKNEDTHIVQSYCKTCGEITDSKTKSHDFEDGECICGAEKDHIHDIATKYINKDENSHTVQKYCKTCSDVIDSDTEVHKFVNGECVCGAKEKHIHTEATKYIYKTGVQHTEQVYCKDCGEVIKSSDQFHTYKNGKCVCGKDEPQLGDVNGDGEVNEADSAHIMRYIKGMPCAITKETEYLGDANSDGDLTEVDAYILNLYSVGAISLLPHECKLDWEYEKIDETNHNSICTCECGKINHRAFTESHTFEDGECVCGEKEEQTIIYGDVDSDGKVTEADVNLLLKYVMYVGEYDESTVERFEQYGDVNEDGTLNMDDVIIIKRYVEGIIDELPYLL